MQMEAHRGFTSSLPQDLITEWGAQCKAWLEDAFPKTAVNPYKVEEISM